MGIAQALFQIMIIFHKKKILLLIRHWQVVGTTVAEMETCAIVICTYN
jgi:hypothetical protein